MGLRFQRRLTLFPGVRLNFSRSGISASIGPRGASMTVGPHGSTLNLGIPGTGVSFRQHLGPSKTHEGLPAQHLEPVEYSPAPDAQIIQSAPLEEITSAGLEGLKHLIKEVLAEREALRHSISKSEADLAVAERRLQRTRHWLLGFFLKTKIPEREKAVNTIAADLKSQRDRLAGAFINAEFMLDEEALAAFDDVTSAFERVAGSLRIWDVTSVSRGDRVRTRSLASYSEERTRVVFSVGEDEVLQAGSKVLRLQNANGADLLMYPGFVLMMDASDIALIDLRDIHLRYRQCRFVEEDEVPSDAVIIDHAWKKCNKDGSPDRRFANNYRIPVAGYGEMTLTTEGGLHKQYEVSNHERAQRFAELLGDYQSRLRALQSHSPAEQAEAAAKGLPVPEATPTKNSMLKSVALLRFASPVSGPQAADILQAFLRQLEQDVSGFNGDHTMDAVEQFVNDLTTIPGILEDFFRRVPEVRSAAAGVEKGTNLVVRNVLAQFRQSIQNAGEQVTSAVDVQHTLKLIEEAENAIRV